jgi:hypothetical protein
MSDYVVAEQKPQSENNNISCKDKLSFWKVNVFTCKDAPLMLARVLPDQLLICSFGNEIQTATITISFDPTIWIA